MEASRVVKAHTTEDVALGRSDFKSAFRALPASQDQSWLSWDLFYNHVKRLQAAPLMSQSFGSLGAVMAWLRTAMLIQRVLEELFSLTTVMYVDDCFWVALDGEAQEKPTAHWQTRACEYVVQDLLGWTLDPKKTEIGRKITKLGLEVRMTSTNSQWQLSTDMAREWIGDMQRFLDEDRLLPSEASKLCGRLQFSNSKIYGKLGRVLIRPLIWRQVQQGGRYNITRRIKTSITWFSRALSEQWMRTIPYVTHSPSEQIIVYSDAESTAHVGLVFVYRGKYVYGHGKIPTAIKNRVRKRRTNISAYEMIAAVIAIFLVDVSTPDSICIRHFVDNQSVKSSIVSGTSKQDDLNEIIGTFWHTAAHRTLGYWSDWVPSELNLSDAPSRRGCTLMKQLGGTEIALEFIKYLQAADNWRSHQRADRLARGGWNPFRCCTSYSVYAHACYSNTGLRRVGPEQVTETQVVSIDKPRV